MKIGILMCGHTRPEVEDAHGDFDAMFMELLGGYGFTFDVFDVEHMQFPDSIAACDGWLLTGSKHGAYEDHPFIPPLEDFIRAARDASVPMVGICFGHQIVAQALGGKVEKFPGGWGLGRSPYQIDGLGQVYLTAWHQDQVTELPKGARVIGKSDFCRYAALAYGDRILTVQPHPEFSGEIAAEYARILKGTGTYPDAGIAHAAAEADKPIDQKVLAKEIARLFLSAHEAAHV